MFKFNDISMLNYIFLIPLLWLLAIWILKRNKSKLAQIFKDRALLQAMGNSSAAKRWLKLSLISLTIAFWVIALARPQLGQKLQEVTSQGVEVLLLVDVSNSMLAEDIKPSRLEQAKKELLRLLSLRIGDRIGIVAFSGTAALITPLTVDKSALAMYLESLTTDIISSQGTNFYKAFEIAQQAFQRGGVEQDEIQRVTRVIIVASDGENNEQASDKLVKRLVDDGIHVFALAFGTQKGSTIPVRDEQGYLRGYKKDRSGQEIITKVDGESLRQIAQIGKGSFYHITYGSEAIKQLAQDLDRLENVQFASAMVTEFDEYYQFFLLLGIVCAAIELIIGERRNLSGVWRGRFEQK